ncbi:glycoside hydrolase family 2 protein [Alginatibacterium sediminis]|uniref:Beta-mannosidase B n=1 Tax=Alginatibacterium sediminis TaxID=2164068 RepID=A0A420EI11_9ALTE|nr:glycoside hydrolase family 2 protein [Alginatibacterium sediminis]RKF20335.1 glycoside hydrolase family 2 protein [Alginatibacterium sediminis]
MRIDLGGAWTLNHSQRSDFQQIAAQVPGTLYTDLLAAELIDDPLYGDNEAKQYWIGESDWSYERHFQLTEAQLDLRTTLVCEGLDTLCDIFINGQLILSANNQFRRWTTHVSQVLIVGDNHIRIEFRSPFTYAAQQENTHGRVLNQTGIGLHRLNGGGWLRKSPCNFGWDWGPRCVTCGIPGNIYLESISTTSIATAHIHQDHLPNAGVRLVLSPEMDFSSISPNMTIQVRLTSPDGEVFESSTHVTPKSSQQLAIEIQNPRLWWPNGIGEQALYHLGLTLYSDNQEIDQWQRNIGLRKIELNRKPDQWGESFQFHVNGLPVFSKGANWIPADVFPSRIEPELYETLIRDTAAANMNMLRVWGGGIYEPDLFYDLCDKHGIMVWQDFMFACTAYPAFDPSFISNVKIEAAENIKRIRHHACLALWCGNNEIEHISDLGEKKDNSKLLIGDANDGKMTWEEYCYLYDDVLREQVQTHNPQTDYWPSSPHTPRGDRLNHNSERSGDAHLWEVWHGRQPFEYYRDCEHRFNSEFGFQSFPEPATVNTYTTAGEHNISSYEMEYHQRSPIGNSTIIDYMLSWFQLPNSEEQTLWVSQIVQGMAIKYAVEHWRRSMPRGMGTLYWQLNDCWGGPSWSSIDYLGRWKALHYMARDFNAPLLISALENKETLSADIYISNDSHHACSGEVRLYWYSCAGKLINSSNQHVEIKSFGTQLVLNTGYEGKLNHRDLILYYELYVGSELKSKNLSLFGRPKHLKLEAPQITLELSHQTEHSVLTLRADKPALWVRIEQNVVDSVSDQFFHLLPNIKHEIHIPKSQQQGRHLETTDFELISLRDSFIQKP